MTTPSSPRALTVGEKRRAMSADGARRGVASVWRRAVEGCAKPGCVDGVVTFQYNSPFTLVRCDDCPYR